MTRRGPAVAIRLDEPAATAATMDLLPRLVPLGANLWGASFTLMKMLPAQHILRQADAHRRARAGHRDRRDHLRHLRPGPGDAGRTWSAGWSWSATRSSTSGCTGGWPTSAPRSRCARPPSPRRRVPDGPAGAAGRGPRAAPGHASGREQYANPDNPRSYAAVAELLLDRLGQVDCAGRPGRLRRVDVRHRRRPALGAAGVPARSASTPTAACCSASPTAPRAARAGHQRDAGQPGPHGASTRCTGARPRSPTARPGGCTGGTRCSRARPAARPSWWPAGGRPATRRADRGDAARRGLPLPGHRLRRRLARRRAAAPRTRAGPVEVPAQPAGPAGPGSLGPAHAWPRCSARRRPPRAMS